MVCGFRFRETRRFLKNSCAREGCCATLPLWQEMDQLVHDFLYQKKLTDLVSSGK